LIVPRSNIGFVPTSPLPHPRVGNAFEPPQPIDISPVTRLVSRIVEEEQAKADTTALIGADGQLASLHNSLLYDPENGALAKRGFDAGPASKSAMEAWQKGVSDISGTLSPNQQIAFQRVAAQRTQDLDNTLARHAATEIDRGKEDTTNANLSAERTATLQAYGDPKRVQAGIDHQKMVIALDGASRGQSPEVINQRIQDEVSKIHSGVIHLLLADDRDIDATKYFEAHAKELDPQALLQAKDSLDLGSLRGESQRRSDSIVSSTATLGGALQEAAKITDPKLREATEGRIRRHFEDVEASIRYDRDQAYEQASAILEQTGDLHRIPPDIYNRLNAAQHRELEHRLSMKRSPERATNWDTYARLLNMAGLNDSTRQEFEQLDLRKYRGQLSDQHYEHLLTLQLGERRQTGGAISSEAKVPGAPLRNAPTALRLSPKGKKVPHAWVDRASRDENYKHYLEHMGVVFDSAFSSPAMRNNGDINLR
jgi:hypothetical protein